MPPPSRDGRASDLQGQVYELQRRLRQTEVLAQEHGQHVQQQASAGMSAVYHQEEAMRQQFEARGHGANQEITSLINSFHASTIRGEQGEETVANLEARLHYVESSAAEVRGRHEELYQTTAQIRAAELSAASTAQLRAHAQQEVLTARNLNAEMVHVQTATEQLRSNLSRLESQACWESRSARLLAPEERRSTKRRYR